MWGWNLGILVGRDLRRNWVVMYRSVSYGHGEGRSGEYCVGHGECSEYWVLNEYCGGECGGGTWGFWWWIGGGTELMVGFDGE